MKLIWRMDIGDRIWRISLEIALGQSQPRNHHPVSIVAKSARHCLLELHYTMHDFFIWTL
jgi:hypothetical protein